MPQFIQQKKDLPFSNLFKPNLPPHLPQSPLSTYSLNKSGKELEPIIASSGVGNYNSQALQYIHKDDARRPFVVIDPGHGGTNNGAENKTPQGKVALEKSLTLESSKQLAETLYKEGFNVVLTRNRDSYPGLLTRAIISNKLQPDYLLSIHYNSFRVAQSKIGAEIFSYYSASKDSKLINSEISKELRKVDDANGKSYRGHREKGFMVLKEAKVPSGLVELSFMQDASTFDASFRTAQLNGIAKALKFCFVK